MKLLHNMEPPAKPFNKTMLDLDTPNSAIIELIGKADSQIASSARFSAIVQHLCTHSKECAHQHLLQSK